MLELRRREDAGRIYAALRAARGLSPLRGTVLTVEGIHGPVLVRCGDQVYTLMRRDGSPVTER